MARSIQLRIKTIMEFKKLFKTTSVGKTQVWWMEIDGDKYRAHSGQKDGKIVTSAWTIAVPKNIGKKNATNGSDQALSEVESTYTDKKKKGYVETLEDLENGTFNRFQAMLAKDFKDAPRKKDVAAAFSGNKKVGSQPKLDGFRCNASEAERLMSRWGTEFVNTPHILEACQVIFLKHPGIVIDGELYNHELRADFNSISSLVRKEKPEPEHLKASADIIRFHIYDCFLPDQPNMPFSERLEYITKLVTEAADDRLVLVPTTFVKTQAELDVLYENYLENEYEGQMIRLDGKYKKGGRSADLLKRKEFQDGEFKVSDITEGIGNRAGMAGRCFCVLPDGRTFRANIKGTREFLRMLLTNKHEYIGGDATVEFGNYTPAGIPRFGRIKTFWPGGRNA